MSRNGFGIRRKVNGQSPPSGRPRCRSASLPARARQPRDRPPPAARSHSRLSRHARWSVRHPRALRTRSPARRTGQARQGRGRRPRRRGSVPCPEPTGARRHRRVVEGGDVGTARHPTHPRRTLRVERRRLGDSFPRGNRMRRPHQRRVRPLTCNRRRFRFLVAPGLHCT